MNVKTDHKWKPLLYESEIPERYRKSFTEDYDWMDGDDKGYGWIVYRNRLYHTSDFIRFDDPVWHGYAGDTYFSGTVIELSGDGESYRIGYYIE